MFSSRHRSQGVEMDSPTSLEMETPDFKPRVPYLAVGAAGLLGWQREDPGENLLPRSLGMGFPGGSVGKESDCNAGDPGSNPGSGRYVGEGIGYPLQYSWASLVAQLVKNLPAMWEIWEDPLEKGRATHSSILAWKIPWTVLSIRSQRMGHD